MYPTAEVGLTLPDHNKALNLILNLNTVFFKTYQLPVLSLYYTCEKQL